MAKLQLSTKRLQVARNNALIIGVVAGAAFVATFSMVASKALLSKQAYQGRVIDAKEKAVSQLKANKVAVSQLVQSYKTFTDTPTNILGGNSAGPGDRDGDNARIVLDSLPSKYDFPALTTSIEKILTDHSFTLQSISGTDDEIAQSKAPDKPVIIDMPFKLSVSGNYTAMGDLFKLFENSIRPFNIQSLELAGTDAGMTVNITMKTYYLPEKTLTIDLKVIK